MFVPRGFRFSRLLQLWGARATPTLREVRGNALLYATNKQTNNNSVSAFANYLRRKCYQSACVRVWLFVTLPQTTLPEVWSHGTLPSTSCKNQIGPHLGRNVMCKGDTLCQYPILVR